MRIWIGTDHQWMENAELGFEDVDLVVNVCQDGIESIWSEDGDDWENGVPVDTDGALIVWQERS